MRNEMADADAVFARIVASLGDDRAVTPPSRAGGAKGLKVNGKLFAMTSKGSLVVKLPRARAAELVAAGTGTRFDPGHGRLMNEWVTIALERSRLWGGLVEEARQFVGGNSPR
jgi:hypothetical protein